MFLKPKSSARTGTALGEPEDFGGIAVYLTSNASAYHSGDLFVIDGAYSIF